MLARKTMVFLVRNLFMGVVGVVQLRVESCQFFRQKPFYDSINGVHKLVNGTLGSRYRILINMKKWKS